MQPRRDAVCGQIFWQQAAREGGLAPQVPVPIPGHWPQSGGGHPGLRGLLGLMNIISARSIQPARKSTRNQPSLFFW